MQSKRILFGAGLAGATGAAFWQALAGLAGTLNGMSGPAGVVVLIVLAVFAAGFGGGLVYAGMHRPIIARLRKRLGEVLERVGLWLASPGQRIAQRGRNMSTFAERSLQATERSRRWTVAQHGD